MGMRATLTFLIKKNIAIKFLLEDDDVLIIQEVDVSSGERVLTQTVK